jgi:hypothetical protein
MFFVIIMRVVASGCIPLKQGPCDLSAYTGRPNKSTVRRELSLAISNLTASSLFSASQVRLILLYAISTSLLS